MSSRRSRIFGLLLGLLFCGQLSAQIESSSDVINPTINSPFSRFGLGDFMDQYFAASAAMAGLRAAYQDPYHMNLDNPASLASLRATSFEVGLGARYSSCSLFEDLLYYRHTNQVFYFGHPVKG